VIVTPAEGPGVIVKVFRTLAAGDNPDVVVQAALAEVGCERVPAPVGWLAGTWPPPGAAVAAGEPVHGHLAVAAEFLAGAQDAWREALAAVTAGRGFDEEARALGAATGEVHLALARALPTRPAGPEDREALTTALRDRAAWALLAAPALTGFEPALQARLDAAGSLVPDGGAGGVPAPVLQQVHGDLHLGQVLHAPGRGWVLLDFEGEPLRPLAERTRPDLALRDVAGMLRSFDYAAATAQRQGADPGAARRWDERARAAFCEGYAVATGHDPRAQRRLLDALELDKALYEVVYETRNRPSWVPVPLSAVERLLLDG
jgi:1,4-alpha-glucan branching enzyme